MKTSNKTSIAIVKLSLDYIATGSSLDQNWLAIDEHQTFEIKVEA